MLLDACTVFRSYACVLLGVPLPAAQMTVKKPTDDAQRLADFEGLLGEGEVP